MKSKACLVIALTLVAAMPAVPAAARRIDLVKAGSRLGPIRLFETTLSETKSWFGAPTHRRKVTLECIEAIEVRWGRKLEVYFEPGGNHVAIEGEIRRRRLRSREHGVLRPQSTKGLRVADGNHKLRRLYPKASAVRHGNHYDYFLRSSPEKGRLVAITKYRKGHVRALFTGPYETC